MRVAEEQKATSGRILPVGKRPGGLEVLGTWLQVVVPGALCRARSLEKPLPASLLRPAPRRVPAMHLGEAGWCAQPRSHATSAGGDGLGGMNFSPLSPWGTPQAGWAGAGSPQQAQRTRTRTSAPTASVISRA